MKFKSFLFVSTIALFINNVVAQSQDVNLKDIVQAAYNNDKTIQKHQLEIESSRIDKQSLKEISLPHLNIKGQYAFTYANTKLTTDAHNVNVGNNTIPIPGINTSADMLANIGMVTANADVVIYSGGKVPYLKKAVDQKIKAQEAIQSKNVIQVTQDAALVYDQLQLLHSAKKLLDQSELRLAENEKTAQKAYEYGLMTKYELQKIEVAKTQLAVKQLEYQGKYNLLQQQLTNMTGNNSFINIEPKTMPMIIIKDSMDLVNSNELKALEAQVEAKEYMIKSSKTWWIPKVKGMATAGYANLFNASFSPNGTLPLIGEIPQINIKSLAIQPSVIVGVGFQWDIFDGMKGIRETQKASLEKQKSIIEKDEAEEKLSLYLAKLKSDYANQLLTINLKKKEMNVAENALQQANKEFKTGLIKSTDLLAAEIDFQNASNNYIQSIFDQRQIAIKIMALSGDIDIDVINY